MEDIRRWLLLGGVYLQQGAAGVIVMVLMTFGFIAFLNSDFMHQQVKPYEDRRQRIEQVGAACDQEMTAWAEATGQSAANQESRTGPACTEYNRLLSNP